jgi:hypothetical protein
MIVRDGLPFVTVTLHAKGWNVVVPKVLLDTGSAGTVFDTDDLRKIDVFLELTDPIGAMVGIGGAEKVIVKEIEAVELGSLRVGPFVIQVTGLDYAYQVNGIIGADFLIATGARIYFETMDVVLRADCYSPPVLSSSAGVVLLPTS